MSTSATLVVVGAVIFLVGLAKLWTSQAGGFNLSNFGINIGSRQTNKVGNVTAAAHKGAKPDWIGLAIAALGLLTALVGWLQG